MGSWLWHSYVTRLETNSLYLWATDSTASGVQLASPQRGGGAQVRSGFREVGPRELHAIHEQRWSQFSSGWLQVLRYQVSFFTTKTHVCMWHGLIFKHIFLKTIVWTKQNPAVADWSTGYQRVNSDSVCKWKFCQLSFPGHLIYCVTSINRGGTRMHVCNIRK